jgi:hypothetical protein
VNSEGADPGWRPAFSQATRALVRFGVKTRAERVPDASTATRVIFLGVVYALFMFLLVLVFIEPTNGVGVGRAPYLIGLVDVASMSSIWWVLGRPFSTTDAKSLAGSWRTRSFIGLGSAEVVALIAFAATCRRQPLAVRHRAWLRSLRPVDDRALEEEPREGPGSLAAAGLLA